MQQNKLLYIIAIGMGILSFWPFYVHAKTLQDPNETAAMVSKTNNSNTVQSLRDPAKLKTKTSTRPKTVAKTIKLVGKVVTPPVAKPIAPKAKPPLQSAVIVPPDPPQADIPTPPKPAAKDAKLIVIDAGHGGQDSGAISVGGRYEKNLTLTMARLLRDQLKARGYRVALTRDSDIFIPLYQRVKIARDKKADLFVSLHADSMPDNHDARGLSIYTLSDKATDEVSARLAARENKADIINGVDLGAVDPDVSNILLDLTQRETGAHSTILASNVVQSVKSSHLKTLDGPVRSAGFAVLKAPDMPSALIEMGFLSNPTEEDQLFNPDHQTQLAKAAADGIDHFFEDVQ